MVKQSSAFNIVSYPTALLGLPITPICLVCYYYSRQNRICQPLFEKNFGRAAPAGISLRVRAAKLSQFSFVHAAERLLKSNCS